MDSLMFALITTLVLTIPVVSSYPASSPRLQIRQISNCITQSSALQNLTITSLAIFKGSPFARESSSISFQLFNTAIQIDAQCSAYDIALTPNAVGADPYKWYTCFMESRDPRMSARFRYDATLNHLTVDERWVCDSDPADQTGTGRGGSVQFTASNFEWLDVECVDKGGSHVDCIQPEGTEIHFPIEITSQNIQ